MNAQLEEIVDDRTSVPVAHAAHDDRSVDSQSNNSQSVTSESANSEYSDDQELIFRRTLASSATLSLVLALAGFVTFFDTLYLFVPIVTVLVAIAAISKIRKYPDEIYGVGLAKSAIVIAVVTFCASIAWDRYVYHTEVPEGYTRVEFRELKPDDRHPDAHIKTLERIVGQKVFIKGYILDNGQKSGITEFIMCRDKGDCCFGGNPKIEERISVVLDKTDPGISYNTNLHKLTGTFRFQPGYAPDGKREVLFHLDDGLIR